MADRPTASQITDDQLEQLYAELEELRERNHYLEGYNTRETDRRKHWHARAERAEQQAANVRALHQPTEGQGWDSDEDDTPGSYGHIAQACGTCGTSNEYAVRWPCATIRALDNAAGQPDTSDTGA